MFYTENDIKNLFVLLGIWGVDDFDNLTSDQQILLDEIFRLSYQLK